MRKSTHSPEYHALRGALRTARESANLSQRELAHRLKVPHSWVAKVESGERRVDMVEAFWLLSACGADLLGVTRRLMRQFTPHDAARR